MLSYAFICFYCALECFTLLLYALEYCSSKSVATPTTRRSLLPPVYRLYLRKPVKKRKASLELEKVSTACIWTVLLKGEYKSAGIQYYFT